MEAEHLRAAWPLLRGAALFFEGAALASNGEGAEAEGGVVGIAWPDIIAKLVVQRD